MLTSTSLHLVCVPTSTAWCSTTHEYFKTFTAIQVYVYIYIWVQCVPSPNDKHFTVNGKTLGPCNCISCCCEIQLFLVYSYDDLSSASASSNYILYIYYYYILLLLFLFLLLLPLLLLLYIYMFFKKYHVYNYNAFYIGR